MLKTKRNVASQEVRAWPHRRAEWGAECGGVLSETEEPKIQGRDGEGGLGALCIELSSLCLNQVAWIKPTLPSPPSAWGPGSGLVLLLACPSSGPCWAPVFALP